MKKSIRNQMLKEHFNHFEEINGYRDKAEYLLKWGLYRFTGWDSPDGYGHYQMNYGLNKWNPVIWLSVILGFFMSMFEGGIIYYIKDFPERWNFHYVLLVKNTIYHKYRDMA